MSTVIDSSKPHCGRCPLVGQCLSGDHVDQLWLHYEVCSRCGVFYTVPRGLKFQRRYVDPYTVCSMALFYMIKHGGLGTNLCGKEACWESHRRTRKPDDQKT